MRNFFALITIAFLPFLLNAQFVPTEKSELTIIVTDGTDDGTRSEIQTTPKSPQGTGGAKNSLLFTDPIRPLGMENAIQAAAFLEKPDYGLAGFLLIFCVNDSIGDNQGTLTVNGETFNGVYRLIRQKFTAEEPIPEGMAAYKLKGKVIILGVS